MMKILLPLDGNPKSETILPFAVNLALRREAELIAVRVMDPVALGGEPLAPLVSENFYRDVVAGGEEYLATLPARYPDVNLRTICQVGFPRELIRELAEREKCDLIVFASHGHSGLVRWIWGSLAEGVSRVAPCPVLLVRGHMPLHFHNVLIPIDSSAVSASVAERVSPFLEADSNITVLHCADAKHPLPDRPALDVKFSSSPAPEGISQWLASHDCDLVAMSSHGRDGIDHMLWGSVAEQVARTAPCPVMIFPPSACNSH